MSESCCRPGAHGSGHGQPPPDKTWFFLRLEYIRLAVVLGAIAITWFGSLTGATAEVLGVAALAFCGFPIFKEALAALLQKRMTMELSMMIALCAAMFIGEVLTALVIVLFVLVAEDLEKRTIAGGRRSIRKMLSLLPQTALRKNGQALDEVPLDSIKPGDVVVIKPGARVVVDGTVVSGTSFIDESAVTGESVAAEKLTGSTVYAGTINQSGALEVRADRIGNDTTFGRIIDAVEEAERTRANVQKLADRVAGYIVGFALSAAAVTFLMGADIHDTISVVLVAGACGIAAGTPLAVLGSIAYAARRGSIVKGGLYMEKLANVDTIVFDKTGTLTFGTPEVVSVLPTDGVSPTALMQAAATAERVSEHPLAKAILARSQELKLDPSPTVEFAYKPGRGIVCRSEGGQAITVGNKALLQELKVSGLPAGPTRRDVSEVLVARDGQFMGRIQVSDRVRPEARQVVQELKSMGVRVIMLTGDAEPVAKTVAAELGIDEVAADLRPEDKCSYVARLRALGRKVAVVGDGINDAPALVEADVGIAVGSGTAIALESADVVLINNNLTRLVDTLRVARRCQRVIYFNLIGTIIVDLLGMLAAACGLLNPLLAAFVHVGSELAFIANSARLFPVFTLGDRDNKK